PLRPATRLCLGRPLPCQLADGPRAHPQVLAFVKRPALTAASFEVVVLCVISTPFGMLSPARGKITHVLLTRAPLYRGRSPFSWDLQVVGAPLTFVLSQDQTLQLKTEEPMKPRSKIRGFGSNFCLLLNLTFALPGLAAWRKASRLR